MTDTTPVLIEAAINGMSTKDRNPNVPITARGDPRRRGALPRRRRRRSSTRTTTTSA